MRVCHAHSRALLLILQLSRLITDKRLRVLEQGTNRPLEDIWAIGDASVMEGPEMLPATAQVAAQKAIVRLSFPAPFLGFC